MLTHETSLMLSSGSNGSRRREEADQPSNHSIRLLTSAATARAARIVAMSLLTMSKARRWGVWLGNQKD